MPLGLKLPPLFVRQKTASSSASSEPDSRTTAASSAINSSTHSLVDSKKQPSGGLFAGARKRGRSKASSKRAPSVPPDETRKASLSISPPSTSPAYGVESALLGSVGEEREEQQNVEEDVITRPALVLQQATPPSTDLDLSHLKQALPPSPLAVDSVLFGQQRPRSSDGLSSNASPKHVSRRPSLVDSVNAAAIVIPRPAPKRMPRKIWVKRPNASATLVQVGEDDLVDDVRDMILRKYANSLGRTFDAPDMTLKIVARSEIGGATRTDRLLGPEEEICRTLDLAYPGGQTVDEALIIDVPKRRTPKPSPGGIYQMQQHHAYLDRDEMRPSESQQGYFDIMAQSMLPMTSNLPAAYQNHDHKGSMAVVSTGQLPPIPSPGSIRGIRHGQRPRPPRQHTSSPTISQHFPNGGPMTLSSIPAGVMRNGRGRVDSSASDTHRSQTGNPPHPPPIPEPPVAEAVPVTRGSGSTPPTPSATVALPIRPGPGSRTKTHKPGTKRPKRSRATQEPLAIEGLPPISNMLEGVVPPINVLIVEDNLINMSVLERLMKRLRVRWSTAVNGQIAVEKWRKGGFHLIFMDIQMPVMNGLQATKEIRRLEKVNGIGVFSSSAPTSPEEVRKKSYVGGVDTDGEATDTGSGETTLVKRDPAADKLVITEGNFKSPIIIVALTASSLQSDRHEALAAGCNDFLTKPVQGSWLERKVKEWGCMQALIDFDGWKRWRDINEKEDADMTEEQKKEREKAEKAKKRAAFQEAMDQRKADAAEKKKKAANRVSMDASSSSGAANGTTNSSN